MRPIYIIRWSRAVGGIAVVVVLHSLMLQGDDNDISGPLWMVRTPGNSYRVAAAYMVFAMVGIMFVGMDVGVAAAYVRSVMKGMLFVCMDVGVAAGAPSQLFPNGRSYI